MYKFLNFNGNISSISQLEILLTNVVNFQGSEYRTLLSPMAK